MKGPDWRRVRSFRARLMRWAAHPRKDYPWRKTRNPYRILVSEFMLHRTQARQVETVYRVFISKYPTLRALAGGDRRAARRILRALGLNWRTRGMLRALDELWSEYGTVPADYAKLMSVPGIGPYIAGATVCFSGNVSLALVDTNTVRVAGRVLGLDLSGEARRRKVIIEAIGTLCDPERPRDYYYALIDLAHTVCRPRDPACTICPLVDVPCRFAAAGQGISAQGRANRRQSALGDVPFHLQARRSTTRE
jgi:A/G-specific adenine glycosylase